MAASILPSGVGEVNTFRFIGAKTGGRKTSGGAEFPNGLRAAGYQGLVKALKGLPNAHPVLGVQPHAVAGLDSKGGVKGVLTLEGPAAPELVGGVDVGLG